MKLIRKWVVKLVSASTRLIDMMVTEYITATAALPAMWVYLIIYQDAFLML